MNYRYGILIPTYGRLDYVEKCFISLRDSNLPREQTLLIIIDESMTINVDVDKENTQHFIKEFTIEGISIIKIYKKKHGNMYDSLLIGLDLIHIKCGYVMNLDSDTIHKLNWIDDLQKVDDLVRNEYPNRLLVITGYNSICHEILEKKQEYIMKKSVGGCHLFFKSVDYINYLRYTIISHKWDTNIYEQVHHLGGLLICTNPSIIEHIGEFSSVRNEINNDKSFDY